MTLTTKLAVAMIALVAVTISAIGWLNYRSLEQALLPRVLDRIESQSQLAAADLEAYVAGARGDVANLQSGAALDGLMRAREAGGTDPVDGVSEKTWRERLAARLVAELDAKPAYADIRVIGVDDNQREIIRVDRRAPNDAVEIVPDERLARNGDRVYFKQTIKLRTDEIYVSPLTLERRGETIIMPPVPMLRVATPIFTTGGKLFGIFIISLDMRPAFDRVRASARSGEKVYLIEESGDYLVHPDRSREFGSMLGKPTNWRSDFPAIAVSLDTTQSVSRILPDQDGRPGGIALVPIMLAGNQRVAVIKTAPNAVIMATAATIQNTSVLGGLVAVLGAAILAVLMARSLTRPIVQLTAAVEGSGRNGPAAIPVDASGETGVLARAFARVIGEANAKAIELENEVREHRRTEAARDRLAERERLFSAAVESSHDAIITESLDGRITGWNPAAERLFGFSAAEAVGQDIDLIVPSERRSDMRDILSKTGRGEPVEDHETVRLRSDGSQVQVSISISPIRAPSGTIIGVSKIVRDITEARKTREALNQQIEERRRIFETSQDLILVTDSRGVLVQVSPSSRAILGYAPEEMIGFNSIKFIFSDDLNISRDELRAARRWQHTRNFDARFIHNDGRIVTLSWTGTWSEPVRRYFFIGRDATESHQAQQTLRESEQLARGIIDTALDAFIQMTEEGTISDWNLQAENIFGWSRSEALGRRLDELIIPEPQRDAHNAGLRRFLRTGHRKILGRRLEIEALRRDGKEITVELSITELRRRDGVVFNGFVRDLTDRIAAQDRIRQAEKMEALGQLTGGIAHDFNNILTVVTGTIEILAAAVRSEPQLATITRMIDEAAARGTELTQHLLAFARKQPLQPREIDINTLVIDTAKLLRPTLGEQIEIECVFADEICLATVDPNQLTTAILNLALNARDAMPNGGKLVLETGSADLDESYASANGDVQPGRYAVIAVSDSGAGIPAAMLDKVFDPFFTSKGPGKGTGLGLSMVYGFVKQSAGHIKIYSEEGHGTTIRMYLPPAIAASLAERTAASPAVAGDNETILVVEDDRLVRSYVLTQLRSLGYATLDAANAAEALAIVEAGNPFDLLFTDVIMPGCMNGRQLADELQKIKPGLKVLFTSGYTDNAIIHHGRLDSGVLLLAKPYRKTEMAVMIRTALAS
ncbi:MAG: PAS domain S-box protein [Bradyrhizobium sp.]|uniref:PAS domain S-box protein n=1 Tax=Bradyrhizobium sp. TaxID=376 RepID=UPI001C28AFD4|nr:PAS domain S-box protein [Bradyrhizobium sp.]MBU6464469.1 PAS domain S-box protein [Pseudomonadota bacterium]MDE2069348.1 PAS domain S-box protein [Bradyrhizobium sp.]MDE2244009.1 PAS domain S-box protein [Bradyrhizobium sp.]